MGENEMRKSSLLAAVLLLGAAPLFAQYGEAPIQSGQSDATSEENYDSGQTAIAVAQAGKPARKTVKRGIVGDETGVKDLFSRVSQAWASGDGDKLAALFTYEDSSYLNPQGLEFYGRKELAKYFSDELSGPLSGTQQTFSNINIRFYPLASIALVDCTATLSGQKNADGSTSDLIKTHVFGMAVNRTGKNWQVLLMRVFAFQKPPENESGVAVTPRASLSTSQAPAPTATATTTPEAMDELGLPILDLSLPVPSAGETAASGLPMPVATPTPTKKIKK
jgi:uncharacterized protein (TIGR02246 family)